MVLTHLKFHCILLVQQIVLLLLVPQFAKQEEYNEISDALKPSKSPALSSTLNPLLKSTILPKMNDSKSQNAKNVEFKTMLGQNIQPTVVTKQPIHSDKDRCKDCNGQFTIKTLSLYNGVCGRCNKKKGGAPSPKSTLTLKSNCNNCMKSFTQKTLDKYGGSCGKCHNKLNPDGAVDVNGVTIVKVISQKGKCSGSCGKEYTLKTLEKCNGMCSRCATKSLGGRSTPPVNPLFTNRGGGIAKLLAGGAGAPPLPNKLNFSE